MNAAQLAVHCVVGHYCDSETHKLALISSDHPRRNALTNEHALTPIREIRARHYLFPLLALAHSMRVDETRIPRPEPCTTCMTDSHKVRIDHLNSWRLIFDRFLFGPPTVLPLLAFHWGSRSPPVTAPHCVAVGVCRWMYANVFACMYRSPAISRPPRRYRR